MIVARSREELRAARDELAGRVGVVMTMGALHAGHGALLERAEAECDSLVVTVFVNPLQFGPAEDLDRYPRTLDADLLLCEQAGADVVFVPDAGTVYPETPVVRVSAGAVGAELEGASRPGHFDGVLTVVLKLLHLVAPHAAYFGEKDAQQLACIRRMVRDLDVPVDIVAVPTVRDDDGLALSSRNRYLSETDRASALVLRKALLTRDVDAARSLVSAEPGVALDYLERVDSRTFGRAADGDLLVVAARVGGTRLIDCLHLADPDPESKGA